MEDHAHDFHPGDFAHHLKPSVTSHFRTVVNQTNVVFVGQDKMRSPCRSPRDAKLQGLACWKARHRASKKGFVHRPVTAKGTLCIWIRRKGAHNETWYENPVIITLLS